MRNSLLLSDCKRSESRGTIRCHELTTFYLMASFDFLNVSPTSYYWTPLASSNENLCAFLLPAISNAGLVLFACFVFMPFPFTVEAKPKIAL
jgi:hypothetical protein